MESTELIKIQLTSPAFEAGEKIPTRFTCDGEDISPELQMDNLPPETQSLAIIMDDPDAPSGTWTHWLVWNILPDNVIKENNTEGVLGINDFGSIKYQGPCPPIGSHRYFFRVYALDTRLSLPFGSTHDELLKAMEYHILGSGELMGVYSLAS